MGNGSLTPFGKIMFDFFETFRIGIAYQGHRWLAKLYYGFYLLKDVVPLHFIHSFVVRKLLTKQILLQTYSIVFHWLQIFSSFLGLIKVLHLLFLTNFPNPMFIQGPTFILFVKFSRPDVYSLQRHYRDH